MIDATIVIPTLKRPAKLERCLRLLSAQDLPADRFEVLVGPDGPDDESVFIAQRVARETSAPVRVVPGPRAGVAGVKNRLVTEARGHVLILINDDVRPAPGFVRAHVEAQAEASARLPGGAMALGESFFLPAHDTSEGRADPGVRDTLFDRLVRETSMVFFYDRMLASPARDDAWHDWGFRHAWNLNLSLPTSAVRAAGCFRVLPHPYGYEDIELAWRLREARAMPVLWRRAARADHDHRMTPEDYLRREERLGEAALGFARTAPACAAEVFGRDIAEPEEASRCAEFIERHADESDAGEHALRCAASRPADDAAPDDVGTLYRLHLPAKRRAFRRGLLRAIVAPRPHEHSPDRAVPGGA